MAKTFLKKNSIKDTVDGNCFKEIQASNYPINILNHHKTNMYSNTERELIQQLRHLDFGVWM